MERVDAFFFSLATVILVVCGFYLWLNQHQNQPRFVIEPSTWRVVKGEPNCEPEALCVRTGDLILSIGGISREHYLSARTVALPTASEALVIKLQRGGRLLSVKTRWEERPSLVLRLERALTASTVLVFWAVGALAVLFLWPRDERRLLLILVSFDTALWLASGAVSATQQAFSSITFHVAVWIFLPLCVHLHLLLPYAWLKSHARHRVVLALYGSTAFLIGLDLAGFLGSTAYLFPIAGALAASLLSLIAAKLRGGSAHDQWTMRLMFFGMVFGLGPVMLIALSSLLPGDGGIANSLLLRATALATLPVWPIAYSYAIYRHQLGAIEVRANRLLGRYGYALICLLTYALGLRVAIAAGFFQRSPEIFSFVVAVLFGGLAPFFFSHFQRLTDRLLIGTDKAPDELLTVLAERLPQLSQVEGIRSVLEHEILPSLMVRESGFYHLRPNGEVEVISAQHPGRVPTGAEIRQLVTEQGRYLRQGEEVLADFAWPRLVLRLESENRLLGVWLFGRRDPDDFYPRSEIVLLKRLAGQLAALLQSFEDRSEKKRLEQLLEQSQKMEAVGRLSAGIAHDFNNLLAVIDMNTGFLVEGLGTDPRRRYAEGVAKAARRASGLTRSLLTFSRHLVVKPQPVILSSLFERLRPLLETSVGDRVRLSIELTPDLPAVKVDPGELQRVLINLTLNARHAMPEGGLLIFTARLSSGPAKLDGEGEEHVVISVRDTGIGIAPEIADKIFEPFFTTKPRGQGTGLGLSLAYGVIQQCGGRISVESESGHGTAFDLHLPTTTAPELAPDAENSRVIAAKPASILLVDDEAQLRAVLVEALVNAGHRVVAAADGLEGLEALGKDRFDLLVSDVVMPVLDGIELARQASSIDPDMRILLISGYAENYRSADLMGNDQKSPTLLQKPFSIDQFLEAVNAELESTTLATATEPDVPSDYGFQKL